MSTTSTATAKMNALQAAHGRSHDPPNCFSTPIHDETKKKRTLFQPTLVDTSALLSYCWWSQVIQAKCAFNHDLPWHISFSRRGVWFSFVSGPVGRIPEASQVPKRGRSAQPGVGRSSALWIADKEQMRKNPSLSTSLYTDGNFVLYFADTKTYDNFIHEYQVSNWKCKFAKVLIQFKTF